jgi:hypothetical protein
MAVLRNTNSDFVVLSVVKHSFGMERKYKYYAVNIGLNCGLLKAIQSGGSVKYQVIVPVRLKVLKITGWIKYPMSRLITLKYII